MNHTKLIARKLLPGTLGIAIATALLPAGASAQQLEEIVVTAQKRQQSLQDVPLSVIAMSGKELENLNRNEVSDLSKSIAGFTFQTGSNDSEKAIQVRGVGTSTLSRGVEQSVGTVIDGVISSGVTASFLDFSDVERVEVLRGPQGMLFGKNASAGLLNITLRAPTDELSYGGSASYGDEDEVKVTAYVSGPLTDTIKGRASYYSNKRDGIIESTHPAAPGELYNDRDESGLSAKLLLEPTDALSVMLSYRNAERETNCCGRPPVTVVGPFAALLPAGAENDKVYEANDSPGATELDVASLELNYEWGDHTLTSITSYTDIAISNNVQSTGLPLALLADNTTKEDIEQFTQELRITSPADQTISYVAGLYYYEKDLHTTLNRIFDLTVVGSPFVQGFFNDSQVDVTSKAVFGQATWNINDLTRLSLGLRYNEEEISMDQTVSFLPLPASFTLPAGATYVAGATLGTVNPEEKDEHVSWRIIAERNLSEDKMIYLSVARGYKGPGANTLATGITTTKPIVDAEIPTNYELGLKSEFMDGRMRLNASIFQTTFEDFQASLSNNAIPPAFFLDNAGELKTEGVELELSAQATENLFVSANIAAIDATFESYPGAACYPSQGCTVQDLSGKDLPFSPDLTVNVFARYDIDLDSVPFNAYVQGAYHWQDEVQFNSSNDPLTIGDAYGIADFTVGLESETGTYSVQLFVKNAFDEFYVSGYSTQGTSFGVLLAQNLEYDYTRRVGIKLQVEF